MDVQEKCEECDRAILILKKTYALSFKLNSILLEIQEIFKDGFDLPLKIIYKRNIAPALDFQLRYIK